MNTSEEGCWDATLITHPCARHQCTAGSRKQVDVVWNFQCACQQCKLLWVEILSLEGQMDEFIVNLLKVTGAHINVALQELAEVTMDVILWVSRLLACNTDYSPVRTSSVHVISAQDPDYSPVHTSSVHMSSVRTSSVRTSSVHITYQCARHQCTGPRWPLQPDASDQSLPAWFGQRLWCTLGTRKINS